MSVPKFLPHRNMSISMVTTLVFPSFARHQLKRPRTRPSLARTPLLSKHMRPSSLNQAGKE